MNDGKGSDNLRIANLIVRSFVVVVLVLVIAYKIVTTPFDFEFDFSALLSLVLALFAMSLAAMFYFKATETSNTFYDNTYKFTRDIADLLARIESGFGERLRHLDESYRGIQDRFDRRPSPEVLKESQEELEEEEQQLQEKLQERDRIIEDLVAKGKLEDREKEIFVQRLNETDNELQEARSEVQYLRRRIDRQTAPPIEGSATDTRRVSRVAKFARDKLFTEQGEEYWANAPAGLLERRWDEMAGSLPKRFHLDMRRLGYSDRDNDLTADGIEFLRELARDGI